MKNYLVQKYRDLEVSKKTKDHFATYYPVFVMIVIAGFFWAFIIFLLSLIKPYGV